MANPTEFHVAHILTQWWCEECDSQAELSLRDLGEAGVPKCENSECYCVGNDMLLFSHATITKG